MPKSTKKQFSIVTSQQQRDVETMFPAPTALISKYSQVGYDQLEKNLGDFVTMLSNIVGAWPERSGEFYVDQATFSLTVNAEGKISLIGEVAAGLNSCITVTLKRGSPST